MWSSTSTPMRLYIVPLIVLVAVVCCIAVKSNNVASLERGTTVVRNGGKATITTAATATAAPSFFSFSSSPSDEDHAFLRHGTMRPTRHIGDDDDGAQQETVQQVAASGLSLASTLARGALLRVASDFAGGTVFENIKTRVTTSNENMWTATRSIVAKGGIRSLWSGSSTRCIEGALVGALFMLGSTVTKQQLRAMGVDPTLTALGGGLVGGIAQAIVMTPAGMVFTSLNIQRSAGNTSENALTVTRRIINERGPWGMYSGFQPMALRQASNWASRAGLTEVARSVLGLQRYGLIGEIGSGVLGGVGSCWNTPIELSRVLMQRDLSVGLPTKTIMGYWREAYEKEGAPGLFRGVSPRALQAIWQTCFLVVVPNLMGI